MSEFLEALRRALRSPAFKFFLTVFLILLLTIPLLLVYALVWERESRAQAVRAEVGQLWGPEQILGPFLVVPYTVRIETVQGDMILQLEDYALLAGAILGFVALTVVMFVTLRVDWSGGGAGARPAPQGA